MNARLVSLDGVPVASAAASSCARANEVFLKKGQPAC
jgi:hypothetical protein